MLINIYNEPWIYPASVFESTSTGLIHALAGLHNIVIRPVARLPNEAGGIRTVLIVQKARAWE